MKTISKIYSMSGVIFITFCFMAVNSEAFHSGLLDECSGCHSGGGTDFKLRGSDPSSTCLWCHLAPASIDGPSGYYIATDDKRLGEGMPPLQLTPGGDFGYLKKNYTWKDSTSSFVSSGERHGHNIIARDYGYVADMNNNVAPGGKYPSESLSCISCHNKHGIISTVTTTNYSGTYRMLGGIGYTQKNVQNAAPFKAAAPIAVSPSEYNRSERTVDTRIAYGKGMSEWCMNCHPDVMGHPAGNNVKLSADIISNYNSYIKTGNMSGSKNTSYSSLAPFEEGTDSIPTLVSHANSTGGYTKGPDGNANVMCLTCHRAHATGFDDMSRWNGKAKFLTINGEYPAADKFPELAQGRTPSEFQQAYYGRSSSYFGAMQTGYCNKCHSRE